MNHISNGADSTNRFSRCFLSNEGCRMVSSLLVDESKFLSELKKFVERRISLDEQYAKNLQDLSSNFDRVSSGVASHSMIKVRRSTSGRNSSKFRFFFRRREKFLFIGRKSRLRSRKTPKLFDKNSSKLRSKIWSNRRTIHGNFSTKKNEITKPNRKKFLRREKSVKIVFLSIFSVRRGFAGFWATLPRRVSILFNEAQRFQQIDWSLFVAEKSKRKILFFFSSFFSATRKLDESKIKSIKENLNEKRANLCRTHNDYVYKIREYQLIDEENLHRLRSLLNFQEEIQIILARNWLEILDGIDKYSNTAPFWSNDSIDQIRRSIDLRKVYDEFSRLSTNQTAPLTTTPIDFNLLTIELSSLNKLRANRFFGDPSTNKDLKQKFLCSIRCFTWPNRFSIQNRKTHHRYRSSTFKTSRTRQR